MNYGESPTGSEPGPSSSKVYFTPPPPAPIYRGLLKADYSQGYAIKCQICLEEHSTTSQCLVKPPWPPSVWFPERCVACDGFHPKGHCYFEYLIEPLKTPSYCNLCQITHIGYCKSALLCSKCNSKHNFSSECQRYTSIDLSNNWCPNCELCHIYHCPADLLRIESSLILWCNKCKVEHRFMTCTPFCGKCFRRHRLAECPPDWTYCRNCLVCHQNIEECKKAGTTTGATDKITTQGKDSDKKKKEKYYSENP